MNDLSMLRPLLFILTALLSSTTASAQGAPPFELDGQGSASVQVVRMGLGLRDFEEPLSTNTVLETQSTSQTTLNRRQDNGLGGTGRLLLLPSGVEGTGFLTASGWVLPTQISESGPSSFIAYESPSVTPGIYAPLFSTGTYFNELDCPSIVCHQFLEGPIESRAESSYAHAAGTLAVDASVDTPDYGVTDDTRNLYHSISSHASARLGDWIYATGPGATATVVVDATLPLALDDPSAGIDESDWITQGSGDLRELGCFGSIEPVVSQFTRFRYDVILTRWIFGEVCEEDEEGGEPICNFEWIDSLLGTQTVGRTREIRETGCEGTLAIAPSDTGALPGTTQLQVAIPTNQWVQLFVVASTDSRCEGAMGCALVAKTSSPITVSITSPNGTLAAWHGVAGLAPVPEPTAAAMLAAGLGAIAFIGRRRGRAA